MSKGIPIQLMLSPAAYAALAAKAKQENCRKRELAAQLLNSSLHINVTHKR
ncbi:hypothetical protein TUM4438_43690 [Shewanella sairae]|uniref:CopG-like ribbon-helix-helix domain-containing protein n=1 Tax=Shewanella sairae TaxID=190310 RepID=A0ABQ4PRJ3_9GAMM|nr:hypothetical protein [Shewanella sairae]GIU52051.1 hypothetical protein TUM4438_43690 [Shewanella sairae]